MKTFILLLAIVPLLVFAQSTQRIERDTVQIGRPSPAADPKITFKGTTQQIKANRTQNRIQFSNDGTNFKNLGSGGGGAGGENYLQDLNGDAEAGVSNWTNSGGTFTASSTSPIAGDQSLLFTASAASQYLETSLITKKLGAGGRTCQATFDYNWAGVSGELQASVLDQTNAVIAGPINLIVTTSTQTLPAQLPMFDCDTATQYKIRITSTAASAIIKIDNAFIGYGKNELQVSQSEIFGTLLASPAGAWTSVAASLQPVSTIGSVTYSPSGKLLAPSTNIPGFRIATMPPGKYEIITTAQLNITAQTTSTNCQSLLHDGTNFGDTSPSAMSYNRQSSDTDGNGDEENTSATVFTYTTTQTNKTFQLYLGRGSGNGTCQINGNNIRS